ncbi:MAG: aminotransferase class I/II-fold pyridoxal phosphate-dependent enzyme [Steroidobacteraceae bacterium]
MVSVVKSGRSEAELFFNPNVEALPKYNAGLTVAAARTASGREFVARLGSNENPHGCSPAVLRALTEQNVDFSRYSDPGCELLRAALAASLGVDPAVIVIGNGSEEMIAAASRAFLAEGAAALTVGPSFGLHEIEPLAVGATVSKVPMTSALDFDVPGLEAALAQAPNLFFLPSPWNPVGAALDANGLERVIRATSPATMFVLDEAYREFASTNVPDGLVALRRTGKPYIVLRTFSKAFGLAGLRVGYAVCSSPRIARVLAAAKTPFNVNSVAQVAAVAALGDQQWMRDTTGQIRVERERVRGALLGMGLQVAPSEGNFLFFDCGRSSAEVAAQLLQLGVIVKPWLEPKYQGFIRASIGSRQENDLFLDSLRVVLRPVRAGVAAVR